MDKRKFHLAKDLSDAFGYITNKEVDCLQTVASWLPKRPKIVNVGAGVGTSGLAFAEARPDATVFTVDIRKGSPIGGLQNERNAFKDTDLRLPKQILGDSHEAGVNWKRGKADMIFIDAGHDFDEIMGDIVYWRPHIKIGGYMAFHDYGSPHWGAVNEVVNSMMRGYPEVLRADTTVVFEIVSQDEIIANIIDEETGYVYKDGR